MTKAILYLLWPLLWANLNGVVRSKKDGSPIAGVTLTLTNSLDTTKIRTRSSDQNGAFQFSSLAPGEYRLTARHVGYRSYQQKIRIDDQQVSLPAIVLAEASQDLKEVSIRSAPAPQRQQLLDRTVIRVNTGLSNTLEVLDNTPGLEVTEDNIAVHGRPGVTVYIDGHQSYLRGKELISYLKTLPAEQVDKIELMSSPPARYQVQGGNAVIHIKTKKDHAAGLNGSLQTTQGSGSYYRSSYSGTINYKQNRLSLNALLNWMETNNAYEVLRERDYQPGPTLVNQHNTEMNHQKSGHYTAGLDYAFSKNDQLTLRIDGAVGPYRESGDYRQNINSPTAQTLIQTYSVYRQRTDNTSAGASYTHQFRRPERTWSFDADLLNYADHSEQQLSGGNILSANNQFEARVHSLKTDLSSPLGNGLNLEAGLQWVGSDRNSLTRNRLVDSLNSSGAYTERIDAAYLSLKRETTKFSLQAGLRYEQNTLESTLSARQTRGDLLPTLYAAYQLDPTGTDRLNLSASSRIARPGYGSLNPATFVFDQYTITRGNPTLRPERSYQAELSFSHSDYLSLVAIFNLSRNPIVSYYQITSPVLVSTSTNAEGATNISLYTNLTLNPAVWWTMNYYLEAGRTGYQDSRLTEMGFNPQLYSLRGNSSQQFKLSAAWRLELNGTYRTATTYGQGISLPNWRLNARIQKKIWGDRLHIELNAADLFHSQAVRRQIEQPMAHYRFSNVNDTRQFSLTVAYRLGSAFKTTPRKSGLEAERSRAGVN